MDFAQSEQSLRRINTGLVLINRSRGAAYDASQSHLYWWSFLTVIFAAVPKFSKSRTDVKQDHPNSIPQDSKFYLNCPMESQHASYTWDHEGRKLECVSAEHDCLLLIDSMSKKYEGVYRCVASENGFDKAIVQQTLQMNAASATRATSVALLCLLFLISVSC